MRLLAGAGLDSADQQLLGFRKPVDQLARNGVVRQHLPDRVKTNHGFPTVGFADENAACITGVPPRACP